MGSYLTRLSAHRTAPTVAMPGDGPPAMPSVVPSAVDGSSFGPAASTLNAPAATAAAMPGMAPHLVSLAQTTGLSLADLTPTPHGLDALTPALAGYLEIQARQGVGAELVKQIAAAVLEDRYHGFRFTTPAADAQLVALTPDQRRLWEKGEVMAHVRFDPASKAAFGARVTRVATLGRAVEAQLTQSLGPLDAMQARQQALATALRAFDKNDVNGRRALLEKEPSLQQQLRFFEWVHALSDLAPDDISPLSFLEHREGIERYRALLGAPVADALLAAMRVDDLNHSEVVTDDAPDLARLIELATTHCLHPDKVDSMGYAADANKRMIVTRSGDGNFRRSMLRLVERQDEGHVGEPMLVLERTYPDTATEEEKQRILEHVVRRASQLGVGCAFPCEYYWDSSQTARSQRTFIADMNGVLVDLTRRYDMRQSVEILPVLSRASNFAFEYIDSAPMGGAANAGAVGVRRYPQADTRYDNRFLLLQPA